MFNEFQPLYFHTEDETLFIPVNRGIQSVDSEIVVRAQQHESLKAVTASVSNPTPRLDVYLPELPVAPTRLGALGRFGRTRSRFAGYPPPSWAR